MATDNGFVMVRRDDMELLLWTLNIVSIEGRVRDGDVDDAIEACRLSLDSPLDTGAVEYFANHTAAFDGLIQLNHPSVMAMLEACRAATRATHSEAATTTLDPKDTHPTDKEKGDG